MLEGKKIVQNLPPKDLGFGTTAASGSTRLINKDGTFNVRRTGLKFQETFHFYHYLITAPWWKFHSIIVLYFLVVNLCFTSTYLYLGSEHIGGIIATNAWERFYETFFFSAQTLTTVGYGRINPIGFATSAVAALESMLGLLGFALITGVLYGRFSRPDSNVLFSKNVILAPYKEMNGLMFRMANMRKSQLIETKVQFVMGYNKMVNGLPTRAFDTLTLERERINFFPLSWTVVHPIDEFSPLYNLSMQELKEANVEFTVLVRAFDDTFHEQVYSRYSYLVSDLVDGVKFVPTYKPDADGVIVMDFSQFHLFKEAPLN